MEEIITQTDLLHPELLPKRTLQKILEQRHIKLDEKQREDKEVMVEIFLRTVTPKPQRQPRSNRRGQITAKVIKKLDMQRVRSKSESEKSSSIGSSGSMEQKKRCQRGGLLMSTELPSNSSSTSRLKPPPVVIDKGKSVVKLNSRKSTDRVSESSSSPTSGVRNLVIGPSSSTSPKSTTLKVYNSSSSSSKSQETLPKSGETTSGNSSKKTIKVSASSGSVSLKRPAIIQNGEKPVDTSDEVPPKPKIKKISWP